MFRRTIGNPFQASHLATVLLVSCTNNYYSEHYTQLPEETDSGAALPQEPEADSGAPPAGDAGPTPLAEGAPIADTPRQELELDVFDTIGNEYFFVVSDEQLERMNQRYGGGGPIVFFDLYGDIYTPGGEGDVTFADHVLVTTAGPEPRTADFGKIQVRLVGESTGRPWTDSSLPNLKLDSDEFEPKNRIGTAKHLRFNNAIVGSIFREKLTLDLYRELGYPAPRATFAWVSSTAWDAGVRVPYVVVEAYKPQFCKLRADELAGGCRNMWEFPGDFGFGSFEQPAACQFNECTSTRVERLEDKVLETPHGEGFKQALDAFIDWDAFHRFQCLSWILATGDDALHNTNNLVLAERADGKFQYLPYSVDISLGQDWYPAVPLAGSNTLATGCQSDAQCWSDTIQTCEGLVQDFTDADPVGMLDRLHSDLSEAAMLRPGDEARYEGLRDYLTRRLEELPVELELNREAPDTGANCGSPFIDCGGYCTLPEECFLCAPADQPQAIVVAPPLDPLPVEPVPAPPPGDAGVVEPPPSDGCIPPIEHYR